MSTTVPNHSIEAEQYVLGAVLMDNGAFDRVTDILTPDSFWHRPYGQVYSVMVNMILAGKPVDVLTLFEAVRACGGAGECGSLQHLNRLVESVVSAINVRRYAEIVAEHAAGRAIADAAEETTAIARGAGTPAEKLDRIHGLFGALNRLQVRKAPRSLADIATERTEHYERLERGEVAAGWSTGFARIDAPLNGIRPGGLYILGARPKTGKSSLVQCAALFCTYPTVAASAALARVTLAKMSLALAVQMNGLGSML